MAFHRQGRPPAATAITVRRPALRALSLGIDEITAPGALADWEEVTAAD